MRYALQVQYIGKNYAGSQIQFENGVEIETPTIQGELEKAISTLIFGDTENKNRQVKTIFPEELTGVLILKDKLLILTQTNLLLLQSLSTS